MALGESSLCGSPTPSYDGFWISCGIRAGDVGRRLCTGRVSQCCSAFALSLSLLRGAALIPARKSREGAVL